MEQRQTEFFVSGLIVAYCFGGTELLGWVAMGVATVHAVTHLMALRRMEKLVNSNRKET